MLQVFLSRSEEVEMAQFDPVDPYVTCCVTSTWYITWLSTSAFGSTLIPSYNGRYSISNRWSW
jgi:hypothetical protein